MDAQFFLFRITVKVRNSGATSRKPNKSPNNGNGVQVVANVKTVVTPSDR